MTRAAEKKLFAVCLVKNEEDVIADCLRHAANFCDRIYVLDNASTDRTWEIVRGLKLAPVVPVCSTDFPYREYLRVWFMGAKKDELGFGNWWYILDADMFLDGDPREAIREADREGADAIGVNVINFHLTAGEVAAARWEGRQEGWRDRVYYQPYESGEIDLFKNTPRLDYGICARLPLGLTREYSRRPISRHYPHRSTEQLAKRVRTKSGNPDFAPQLKRGLEWEHYLVDPPTHPGLRRLGENGRLDLSGGFSRDLPPLGREGRSRMFALLTRALYPLGLLPFFYSHYNRRAFRRQGVDPRDRERFLELFE